MARFCTHENASASDSPWPSMSMPLARSTTLRVSSWSSRLLFWSASACISRKRPRATSTAGMSSGRWNGFTR